MSNEEQEQKLMEKLLYDENLSQLLNQLEPCLTDGNARALSLILANLDSFTSIQVDDEEDLEAIAAVAIRKLTYEELTREQKIIVLGLYVADKYKDLFPLLYEGNKILKGK